MPGIVLPGATTVRLPALAEAGEQVPGTEVPDAGEFAAKGGAPIKEVVEVLGGHGGASRVCQPITMPDTLERSKPYATHHKYVVHPTLMIGSIVACGYGRVSVRSCRYGRPKTGWAAREPAQRRKGSADELKWAEPVARSGAGSWGSLFEALRGKLLAAVREAKEARRAAKNALGLRTELVSLHRLLRTPTARPAGQPLVYTGTTERLHGRTTLSLSARRDGNLPTQGIRGVARASSALSDGCSNVGLRLARTHHLPLESRGRRCLGKEWNLTVPERILKEAGKGYHEVSGVGDPVPPPARPVQSEVPVKIFPDQLRPACPGNCDC